MGRASATGDDARRQELDAADVGTKDGAATVGHADGGHGLSTVTEGRSGFEWGVHFR